MSSKHHSRDGTPESPAQFTFPRSRTSLDISRRKGRGSQRTSEEIQTNLSVPHQRFVLTDPVAFRYLEEDPAITVVDRRQDLVGYECYIVEQWATSRTHPTFVITTHTGDTTAKVVVGILSVPVDEKAWSARLRVYFKALNQYHARRRETPLGIMMVTNLSGFPSSLTVIPVPEGDLRKYRADFFVNENLKRLGCSGRIGLTFASPNGATIAKYHQLYRVSDKNPLYSSVIELVRQCQAALHLFDTLEIEYVDGLLCDMTEKSINDWWLNIGTEVYNIEPHDGILGPTTVAALLGLVMGARNRLHALGAPVPKDPFDLNEMKKGISHFQKNQRMARNRRLDRKTLMRLHKASEKAASSEGWSVPRAVKSTVAELSGKGGEMLADVVHRRDRAGIAEIETTDIEHFQQLVVGECGRWLWHGKALKRMKNAGHGDSAVEGHLILRDDEQGFTWSGRKATDPEQATAQTRTDTNLSSMSRQMTVDNEDGEREDKPGMMRKATDMFSERRSGFDRFKDAVTGRGHQHKASKDDTPRTPPPTKTNHPILSPTTRPDLVRSQTSPESRSLHLSPERSLTQQLTRSPDDPHSLEQRQSRASIFPPYAEVTPEQAAGEAETAKESEQREEVEESPTSSMEDQTAASTAAIKSPLEDPLYQGVDLDQVLPAAEETGQETSHTLRRTQSLSMAKGYNANSSGARMAHGGLPRHLSFSIAADSTLTYDTLQTSYQPDESGAEHGNGGDDDDDHNDDKNNTTTNVDRQFAYEQSYADMLKRIRATVADLSRNEAQWTQTQIAQLDTLLTQASADQQYVESLHESPYRSAQEARDGGNSLLRDEKETLSEGRKALETLAAKLDYEVGALRSKIEDVELGVEDFERSVSAVEQRVDDIDTESRRGGGWTCIVS